jgi:hypothetical protein
MVAVKAQRWDDIPAAQYARLGTSASGLLVRDSAEIDAEDRQAADQARREYENAHPGAVERREIAAIYARADQRERACDDNNVIDSVRLYALARTRLAAWRNKYPAEARAEDAAHLCSKADHQRELAAGALVYDCDGSISSEDQQRRHDECMAEAGKLEKQALELLAQK